MAKRTKTTAPPPISADPATAYARGVVSGDIVAGPHVRAACKRHLDDLTDGHKRGLVWDVAAVERVVGYFRDVLTVEVETQDDDGNVISAAVPFALADWQAFIVGSLFGWKTSTGLRRFRRAYIEAGKGSGKSPLAAGIGHYMLTATGKLRAEVYSAATVQILKDVIESQMGSGVRFTRFARENYTRGATTCNRSNSGLRIRPAWLRRPAAAHAALAHRRP